MSTKIVPASTAHWLWPPLLLLGCVTALIAWIMIALRSGSLASWMALLSALEVAWVLRLGTLQRGKLRTGLAILATLAIIASANLGIAAAQIGASFGLDPWSSVGKMGAGFAWTLLKLANDGYDIGCYVIALLLAGFSSR